MKLSLILFIICESIALVCICYGVVCLRKSHKKAKAQAEKERKTEYLFLSTSWLMWADLCDLKVSSISTFEESKYGFHIIFAKRATEKIENLLRYCNISIALEGHFEKLESGRYCFLSKSLAQSQEDVESLTYYCSMLRAISSESEVHNG